MNVVWSPVALRKLDEILDFISSDDVDAAVALVDEIEELVLSLKEHPFQGRKVVVFDDETKRELIVRGNYLVVYEIRGRSIEVLTISSR